MLQVFSFQLKAHSLLSHFFRGHQCLVLSGRQAVWARHLPRQDHQKIFPTPSNSLMEPEIVIHYSLSQSFINSSKHNPPVPFPSKHGEMIYNLFIKLFEQKIKITNFLILRRKTRFYSFLSITFWMWSRENFLIINDNVKNWYLVKPRFS